MIMKRHVNKIELFLVVIIVGSIFLLTHSMDDIITRTTSLDDAINQQTYTQHQFMREPFNYDLERVTEIEIYNANMLLMSRTILNDNHKNISLSSVDNKDDIISIMNTHQSGHISVTLPDRSTENLYFKWGYNSGGTRELTVIYNAGVEIQGLWKLNFLCYLILIFVFGLVVLHKLHVQELYIRDYQAVQTRVQSGRM